MNKSKFIWLFGENMGNTANNNSFYFWRHIVEKNDEIEKYFIMKKNKKNLKAYKSLSRKEKKNIVWKDSIKHYILFTKADMLYVSLSYKDVTPKGKYIKRGIKTPLVYLQHGTLAIKKITYRGNTYNNNMFRFLYYNKNIKETLIQENKFKEYQLLYAEFHPRYKELVKRYEEYQKNKDGQKSILWFITWREYFGENNETKRFIENIKKVVNNYKMREFLFQNQYKLKICLHQFFDKEKIDYITNKLKDENIIIVTPKEIDVMDELVYNDILITDYSSVAFDFSLLGKPVILYQPDIKDYSKTRDFYYLNEMLEYSIQTPTKLVTELKKNNINVNEFFKKRLPDKIDLEYIKNGKHIDKIYDEFYKIQKNEVTFIGYNLYGRGGTVSATLALAEGLLEKKYLVKLLSLKKHRKKGDFPNALNANALYFDKKRTPQYVVKRLLFFSKANFGNLKYDCNKEHLIPYAGFALKMKLKNIKSNTVVSTRETLHLFLREAKSPFIKNKIYFFHTFYNILQKQYVGLLEELKKHQLEKAVFITEAGRKQYEEKAGYTQYEKATILNNCLESSKMITRDEIQPIKKKKIYNSIYLLRISEDRIKDLNNLFNFVEYMKKNKFNKLIIHVYGIGDYLEQFLQRIENEHDEEYIKYEGLAENIKKEYAKYDFVTDFSLNHSFGMTYLEAIFNGKMVFGTINQGSKEVFKDMPECYINSYEDLLNKIKKIDKINITDLQKHYDIMYNKYSREVITEKFIKYINE